ncbi:hypothetical protein BJY04DRAFT_219071 [Aspergillus karnatakaensis]|uniref:SRR1 family protein n=1 Tax=Aspergillus karnatakaensis TaxID=1810916 RepID=UPI003CCCE4D6
MPNNTNAPSKPVLGDKDTSCAEALAKVDKWYNSGKPFFTRKALKKLDARFRKPLKDGDKISVKDLAGTAVVATFKTDEGEDSNEGMVLKPWITYVPYQLLKADISAGHIEPASRFCTMLLQGFRTPPGNPIDDKTGCKEDMRLVEEAFETFGVARQFWEQPSDKLARIKTTLVSACTATKVKKIIGLGCGTMSDPDDVPEDLDISFFQHAFLLVLMRLLEKAYGEKVSCGVQDPAYTATDCLLLETHKIGILDDPQGFLEIDDNSLVFASAPSVPVKQIVADIARPAILIWDRVKGEDFAGEALMFNPDSARVRNMIDQFYDAVEFPKDKNFGDMVIYIRRNGSTNAGSTTKDKIQGMWFEL